jgi:predicted nucleic acid-binding protein
VAARRVYLDTNIFIVAFEGEADNAAASRLLEAFGANVPDGPRFCTSEETLAELLVQPFRELDEIRRLRYESLILSGGWLDVGPVTREILVGAALIRARFRNVKLPDAIHLSTALHFRCPEFLSADTGLDGSFSLAYNVGGSAWSSDEVRIVRPDSATLLGLVT